MILFPKFNQKSDKKTNQKNGAHCQDTHNFSPVDNGLRGFAHLIITDYNKLINKGLT